ncbi:MAG: DUF167 domain-containing protein [Acidobacteria bacterium]|nr:MAG: DUF167 domain-containing protein [Acidobacteriota bacterium]REK03974.1 MAG: DUF167 domain-containing protein [Acidobacteriota bacterium]REK15136.1 MAG: DUF167 domain-containing protein [Acidobacteriota bacterium]REK46226.1 MAG: DUF167 domain-containing protein [Acidobacteriota bacterium]
MIRYDKNKETLELQVFAVPKASRTELKGAHDGSLRVKIASPPVDGAANEELEKYFAKLLGIARSRVTVSSGASSRRKTLTFDEISPLKAAEISKRLA